MTSEQKKMRAVYKDEQGSTYSCPVEMQDGQWAMLTSSGPVTPIPLHFNDDVAGRLTFDSYREVEDLRLHLEPTPGQSSFRVLQEAGAKAEMEYRANRQQARREALTELNQPDTRKVGEVRQLNNEWAAIKRPRGGGQFIIKGE